jgi:hypothetical protein
MIYEERLDRVLSQLDEARDKIDEQEVLTDSLCKDIEFLKSQLASSNLIIQQYRMVK